MEAVTVAGLGFANRSDRKSARSFDISIIALNIKCCITAWRRMSMMKPIAGLMAAM